MDALRIGLIRWLLLLCVVCGGCVTSQHPLSDPGASPLDPGLAGTWYFANADGYGYFHIHANAQGTYDLVSVGFETGRGLDVERFRFHTTDLDGIRLLNLEELPDTAANQDSKIEREYRFFLYTLEGKDRLFFQPISTAKVEAAIAAGDLEGSVKRDLFKSVRITDSPQRLREWIAATGADQVFCEPMNETGDCAMGPWIRILKPEAAGDIATPGPPPASPPPGP